MRTQDFGRLLSVSALLFFSFTGTAHGADDDLVTVTGSRVLRQDLSSNSPIATIDEAAIERSGAVNAEDLIRKLPQLVSDISSGVNLGNPGVATLNLRNLGAERTLILIDGKRFVPYDSGGIVDVNNIPLSLVESVDIVTGGASAVYGSDAMAGVINFKLKKEFKGMEAAAHLMQTAESDGKTADLSLTGGTHFAGGRGNAVVFLGWTDRDAVSTADRDFSEFALATATGSRGGSPVDTQGTLLSCFPQFGLPCYFIPGVTGPQTFISFARNGSLEPTGSRLFNYNLYNYLQVPQQRVQGTALVNFDFTDSVSAYGRLTAARTEIDTAIAPSGTFFTRFFTIPLASLSAQARGVLTDRIVNNTGAPGSDGVTDPQYAGATTVTELFGRRTLEVGPRESLRRTVAWQAVAGLQGSLANNWRWDGSYQYSRTRLKSALTNDISEDRMQASMLGCPPGSPAGCVAGNFFGDGNLNQAAADFISLDIYDAIYSDQQVLTGSLSGTLGERLHLPGASAIGAAVGVEYRREKSESFPDDCLRTPGCSGGYGSVVPIRNDYDVKEIFGELLIPVLEGKSFAHRLDVETGLRLSDYSTVGSVTAYKLGGSWSPVSESFRIRGMYQKAVRAPNIFEFGSPRQQNLASASADPCAGTVTDAALRALCVATGVPASLFNGSASSVPNVIAGQLNVFQGGNPNLKEEDSDTWTVGFVWSPSAELSLQLDWYRIRIDNAVSTLAAQNILNYCYQAQYNPTRSAGSASCRLILRNPTTGGLVGDRQYGISQANENIAFLQSDGIDLGANYSIGTAGLGRFDIGLTATQVLKNERKDAQELPTRDCAGKYGSGCGSPDPELRVSQFSNWTIGAFELGYRWRYLKGTSLDSPAGAYPPFTTIDDRHYFDLTLGWKPTQVEGLAVRVGIDNLFDKDPPLVGEDAGPVDRNSGNTYPGTFDVIGRSFFVSATQRF